MEVRLCRVTAAWTESCRSCILHYQKFGRNKTSTVAHNVLITKEAHEKRTLDNQKEECKKKRIPKKKEKEKKSIVELDFSALLELKIIFFELSGVLQLKRTYVSVRDHLVRM